MVGRDVSTASTIGGVDVADEDTRWRWQAGCGRCDEGSSRATNKSRRARTARSALICLLVNSSRR